MVWNNLKKDSSLYLSVFCASLVHRLFPGFLCKELERRLAWNQFVSRNVSTKVWECPCRGGTCSVVGAGL